MPSGSDWKIFCDFDGTITSRDSIVFLTERFGAGADYRNQMLEEITSGRISVFEAIRREIKTVTAPWKDVAPVLAREIPIDPYFETFLHWAERYELPVTVVSSGLKPVLELFLARFDVPYFAHPVKMSSKGWQYRRDKKVDKVRILSRAPASTQAVYIGDGTSDVEVIPYTQILFAKAYLADYCRRNDISFYGFETFQDVQEQLSDLLSGSDDSRQ